jgi:hypothetical protein
LAADPLDLEQPSAQAIVDVGPPTIDDPAMLAMALDPVRHHVELLARVHDPGGAHHLGGDVGDAITEIPKGQLVVGIR